MSQPTGEPSTAPSNVLSKAKWRERARRARSRLVIDHDAHCGPLAEFLSSRSDGWVLGYAAMAGEVDLASLFDRDDLGPFAVTRTPAEGVDLSIHPLDSPVERHRFGFDQPVAGAPVVADDEIAVVLVPGLAFDRLGNRLGHGMGYYDRLLARLRPETPRIGITAGYLVAELPADDHDVAMTHLSGTFGVAEAPLPDPEG